MKLIFIILVIIVICVLGMHIYFRRQPKHIAHINFADLKSPSSPNYCLVYGNTNNKRLRAAPSYPISQATLIDKWQKIADADKSLRLVRQSGEQYIYVTHSKLFAFPDVVIVEIKSLGEKQSKLWIYSYAVYGHSDFGVNCKRVDGFLQVLH